MSLEWVKCAEGYRARVLKGQFKVKLIDGKWRASYETVKSGFVVGNTISENIANSVLAKNECESAYEKVKHLVDAP